MCKAANPFGTRHLVLLFISANMLVGCAPRQPLVPPSVSQAVQERSPVSAESSDGRDLTRSGLRADPPQSQPIAKVNGRAMARQRFLDLLLDSHGPVLLEQLAVLSLAEDIAAQRAIKVTKADIDLEYSRALRRFVDPIPELTGSNFDSDTAEALLESVLEDRNISRGEFMLAIRRNAVLRAIVLADLTISDEQARDQYDIQFGKRAIVRHIQVGTRVEANRVIAELSRGAEFASLAQRMSVNSASSQSGGLLKPFSRNDKTLPADFRNAAFALAPGEVSGLVKTGKWYHVLKLVRFEKPEQPVFGSVELEMKSQVKESLVEPAIQRLYERLFREARITIYDETLRESFRRRFPSKAG